MIFVILGTQDKPFIRLIKAVEKAIIDGIIKDDVIVQAGYTKYKSQYMKIFDLIPQTEFMTYIKQANLIICHGGVGTILTALKLNKKIIAVPRLAKYGEHLNDHQMQIIKCFESKRYILPLYNLHEISEVLNKAKNFFPEQFESNNKNFIEQLKLLINEN